MTEKEAIKKVKEFGLYHAIGDLPNSMLTVKAFEMAIKALEEIQQYRAIGTVEECREGRENQIPKKPIRVDVGHNGSSTDGCPVCKREFYERFNFCPDCGTALGWNE